MLKRAIALSVFAVFILAGCGSAKYGDVKEMMNSQIDVMEKFVSSVEKATSGKEIADAINAYSDDMKKLIPQMNELAKKYPEMKGDEPPAEIKDLVSKMQETSKKFAGALVKVSMKYSRDPEVRKSMRNIGEIMKGLAK
jgi:uncharacterized coiled-coil DUF342 family protein